MRRATEAVPRTRMSTHSNSRLHDYSDLETDEQTPTGSDRDERTGPAGEKCACLARWIDAYEAGEDPLMCFPCASELRRRRREIDREADDYSEGAGR